LKIRDWYAKRGPRYVSRRAVALLQRYHLSPWLAEARIEELLTALAQHGCAPTLPTPAAVVERACRFIRRLQDMGAEIAIHGYEHLDLAACQPAQAREQLCKAVDVFVRHGIEVHGFRCPYLACTDELLDCLPEGLFRYSSNKAIWWDVPPLPLLGDPSTPVFNTLRKFYRPESAQAVVSVPFARSALTEIPVCLPDDLQMHDGLGLNYATMTDVWNEVQGQTQRRGELFVLQFHAENAAECLEPLLTLLQEAKTRRPGIWIARLRDVAAWWQEKAAFSAVVSETPSGLHIWLNCSDRATVLTRNLEGHSAGPVWADAYRQCAERSLDVPALPRPFVGLSSDVPAWAASFLREQGYIVDSAHTARQCTVFLDAARLAPLASQQDLITVIEASKGPLVRFWRWPGGARSAMCFTGDLDALSLRDYASRLGAG
jgi:hypothetical protein